MAQQGPSAADVRAAANAIAHAVSNKLPYAVIGGAACMLLGSTRVTHDVDFVVPTGKIATSRGLLKAASGFQVEGGTNHTTYGQSGVEIDILAPPTMFKGTFDEKTSTKSVGDVRILDPLLLLGVKCDSLFGRGSEEKKQSDAHDIGFLLQYLTKNSVRITTQNLPQASLDFVNYTITQNYVSKAIWEGAGWVKDRGFPSS